MESRMDREMARVDADGTYPCLYCNRRYLLESMQPVSADPSAPLACGRSDCASHSDDPPEGLWCDICGASSCQHLNGVSVP